MDTALFASARERVVNNCGRVIVGKEDVIEKVLITYLCSGHILLEDVPGTGKTMLLRAFSKTVGGDFRRIQFTPDLLPSDLTGINFFNNQTGKFEFREGPLFASAILADEINRATPRTQAALLEAMEEHQITVDGTTYPMAEPFMVMATQNPLESFGTFPLPDAQMDRFFMRLSLGYMERSEEMKVIARRAASVLVEELSSVISAEEIAKLKNELQEVHVSDETADYLMDIIEATRSDNHLSRGASTRGAICLYRAAQAKAALSGRDYVIPEDIRDLAPAVLAHRIGSDNVSKEDSEAYVRRLVASVNVPLEQENR